MTVRILCRVPGRDDVVLTLSPGHYERVDFTEADGEYAYPPHVSILLLEDAAGIAHDPAMHIDPQRPVVVEQLGLAGGAG
jgi:hypothetical protein